ncbi:MAG TPA: lipid-A-disaccharide synthase [Caulobacteraceae bacterium]|nr:lipid-A-disaccharide synthase [Caulobacteraceae bacterium]
MSRPLTVMLVAGEASGDALGAGLARALRRRLGEGGVRFVGVGGAGMAREGVESPFDLAEVSVLGAVEGLMAYPRILRRVGDAARLAAREKPDIAVLIDSWGFTLRVAQRLRRQTPDLPLVKYVGPQVWAWRPGRARTLARAVDHLLAIHTFDAPYFEAEGLATTFVGSSALALDLSGADPDRLRAAIGAPPDQLILLVLPGSRPAEIERLSGVFEDAVHRLTTERPRLRVVVPAAATVAAQVKAKVGAWRSPAQVIEGDGLKFDAMKAATVALACSGTVTSELAMAGCPMVIAYRTGEVGYQVLRLLVRLRFLTLFNIAADQAIAPEFIQHDCTGPKLARAIAERLDDPALRARQIAAQSAILAKMGRGGPNPAEVAADAIVKVLEERGGLR